MGDMMTAMSVGSSLGHVKLPAQGILKLHIIGATSLSHVHLSPTTGPYLAITLGKTRLKTKVDCTHGANPVWYESIELIVSSSDVRKQSVVFQVKNKKKSSTTMAGSTMLGVANVKLISLCAKERTLLIPLKTYGGGGGGKQAAGVIRVHVKFEPWNGRMGGSSPMESMMLGGGEAAAAAGYPPHDPCRQQREMQMEPRQQRHQRRLSYVSAAQMMNFDQRDDYDDYPPPMVESSAHGHHQQPRGEVPFEHRDGAAAGGKSGWRHRHLRHEMSYLNRTPRPHQNTGGALPPLGPTSGGGRDEMGYYKQEPRASDMEPAVDDNIPAHRQRKFVPTKRSRQRSTSMWRVRDYLDTTHERFRRDEPFPRRGPPSRIDEIPSMIDFTQSDDSNGAGSDISSRDHRGRRHQHKGGGTSSNQRRRHYDDADGVASLKSKFLCF